MAIMKRIQSVTILRMIDESPDTSYLGTYSDGRRGTQGEFSIDRKHTFDCASQEYNHNAVSDQLVRILSYLQEYSREIGSDLENPDYWGVYEAIDIIGDALDASTECDCDENGNWSHGECQYFTAGNLQTYNSNLSWITAEIADRPAYWHTEMLNLSKADYERMESYNNGDWSYIGIRAECEIVIGNVCQTITSGGLWGIESDSDESHFVSVEDEELHELRSQLYELGFSKRAIATAFKSVAHKDGR